MSVKGSISRVQFWVAIFDLPSVLTLASLTDQIADHPVIRANRFPQHPKTWEDLLNINSASEDSHSLKMLAPHAQYVAIFT